MSLLTLQEYEKVAQNLTYDTKALIDGALVDSPSGNRFDSISPGTGKVLTSVTSCNTEDVDRAVAAARAAFDSGIWSEMAPADRKNILFRFANLIEQNALELAVMESLDSGKPICDTVEGDIPETVECFRFAAEAIDKINDEVTPTESGSVCLAKRYPIGVCAAILPWNFPILMAAWKLAPILASGNCVVVKPAKLTSLTLLRLAKLSLEAGIPAGVLNILPGSGSVIGNALANHPDVNLITFTGSTEVGRNLLNCSGSSNIKRVLLELGGKNPCVVTDEIEDLDFAAQEIVSGALWNMGENCTQNSRLIIQKSIKNKLLPKILKEVETWKVGNPLDPANRHGAIIEKPHMQKILDYIEIGKNEGADLIYGGTQILEETGGNFIQPSVLDNCNQSMRIVREEIFGPVFAIETFDTLEEGIAMANDTEYGLQASIWSDNLNTVQKLFSKIQAGVISVNHFSEGDITTPFGGFKQSGFMSRDKSIWANKQFTELKSIYIKTR